MEWQLFLVGTKRCSACGTNYQPCNINMSSLLLNIMNIHIKRNCTSISRMTGIF